MVAPGPASATTKGLKGTTVCWAAAGAASASNQKLYIVAQRRALALLLFAQVSVSQLTVPVGALTVGVQSVVEYGSPSQIFDNPQDAYTRQLIAAVPGQHWDPTQATMA